MTPRPGPVTREKISVHRSNHGSGIGWRLCGGLGLAALAAVASRAADAPATAPLTARFVTPDAVVSLVIRPRRVLARLADGGEAVSLYALEAARWSLLQRGAPQHVLRVIETCGFLLHDVEEIGVVGLASGDVAHVIRFARPIDPDLVSDLFLRPRIRDVHGVRTYRVNDGMYAVAVVDDRSLLGGGASVLDALLDPAGAGGPVHDAVAHVPVDADVAGAFSNQRLPRGGLPPGSSLAALEFCSATVRLGALPEARGTATFTDAAGAARGAEELAAVLRQGAEATGGLVEAIARGRPGPPDDAVAGLRSLAGSLAKCAAAFDMRCDGGRLVVSATAPPDAGFPVDLAPLFVLPDAAAARAVVRNDLDEEEPVAEGPLPSHWRRFDVAAARMRRAALHANPVAVRLRNRFPAATGFDSGSFISLASARTTPPRELPDQPVSLLAMTANFFDTAGLVPARDRTLLVHDIKPSELFAPFSETLGFGYASLIRVEDVTGVTCAVEGDTARGTVAFESDLMHGEVKYRAVRDRDGWTFTEFDLPGWGMTCTVRPDGTRSLRSDLGPYGDEPPGRRVVLQPRLDGKPVRNARLRLYRDPQLDCFDVRREDDGRFIARVSPGRYFVEILDTDPPADLGDTPRADGPAVTIPAEPPAMPIPVELGAADEDRAPAAAVDR